MLVANQVSVVPQAWVAVRGSTNIKRTSHRRYLRHGNFILRTRRKIRNVAATQRKPAKDAQSDDLEALEASLTFVPNASQTAQVVVTFQQSMLYEGSLLKRPILCVSAMLREDSKVFQSIENGNLIELIKLLSGREAHLSDRDYRGRSLLNVCSPQNILY